MFTDFARAGCSCEHCDPIRWHPTTPGCWWWPSCLLPAVAPPWCWHHSAWCCESITIDEGWEVRVPGHVNIRGNPVADSAVQDVLDVVISISSLSNLFCTDIWLNSWKQITSNWHSRIFKFFVPYCHSSRQEEIILSQLCSDLSYDIHSFLLKGEPFLPFLTVSLSVFPGFVQTLSSEGTKCTCLRTFSAFLFTTLLPNACMLPSSKSTSSTKPG